MAKLQFMLDGNALGEYELNKERMSIGRRPANDIHIDNLAISGEHAVITTIGDDSFLEDMNSTNGTLVNKKAVKKHVLLHNDVIEFGKYQLLYINAAQIKQPAAQASGFENTVVMRPAKLSVAPPVINDTTAKLNNVAQDDIQQDNIQHDDIQHDYIQQDYTQQGNSHEANGDTKAEVINQIADYKVAAENEPIKEFLPAKPAAALFTDGPSVSQTLAPQAAENSIQVGRLQILSGANSGRELTLNKALTTLGKPGGQLAVITKRPHGYFITHVEGENLPLINGLKIGLQAHALNNHDVIDLADTKMEFFLAQPVS